MPHEGVGECVLLSGVGWYVQALLGLISFLSLIAKRLVEKPRRTWTVFGFDAGKQAIGALFAHSLNLSFASGQSALTDEGDACDYYWLNIILDTTLGVLITYIALIGLLQSPVVRGQMGAYCYGYYGNPPNVRHWASQLLLWLGVIVIMKIAILFLLVVGQDFFQSFAQVALLPFESKPNLKLLIVMIVTPIIMNTFQYWVTDSFLKFRSPTPPSLGFLDEPRRSEDHQSLLFANENLGSKV
eukprot:Gregarina_sp_Pseudo_9__4339@NODE_449_length_2812_cov_14_912730_g425_i0_p2_GENE_NODE_449_length_2812_cov_14_912730_g425_i0NODE_449_length_2812_cov_14_912730_g425_i0_p2_ORF_typecomplete_len242_score20_85STIMATE/PF12400_8/3_1e33_NODE_449_length_2812_cov_14_912730_g425_i015612286